MYKVYSSGLKVQTDMVVGKANCKCKGCCGNVYTSWTDDFYKLMNSDLIKWYLVKIVARKMPAEKRIRVINSKTQQTVRITT